MWLGEETRVCFAQTRDPPQRFALLCRDTCTIPTSGAPLRVTPIPLTAHKGALYSSQKAGVRSKDGLGYSIGKIITNDSNDEPISVLQIWPRKDTKRQDT